MTRQITSLFYLAAAASIASAFPTSQHGPDVSSRLWARAASSVTNSADAASRQSFDYVIVGAGLAGMTLANRLSEGNASVIVIEAGDDTRENTDYVKTVDTYSAAFGNSDFDWAWQTQPNDIDGSSKTIHGGKGLGGSTSINGAAWTKGSKEQYDGLGTLGNDGWSFDDLQHYMTLAEGFTAPDDDATSHGASYDESAHGFSGPVQTWFTDSGTGSSSKRAATKRMYTGPGPQAFVDAQKAALGVEHINDLGSGSPNGVAMTPNTINPSGGDSQLRVSSATAYLSPIEFSRPNLVVLTSYRTTQINWADDDGSSAKATGVTISQSSDGDKIVINANKEVILSAGAINSPVLLEASGVGSSDTLNNIGVQQRVDLPGVGLNLAEQTMNTIGSESDIDYSGGGPSSTIAFPSVKQLFSNWTDVQQYIEDNMNSWAQDAVDNGAAVSVDGLLAQYKVAVSNIFDSDAPIAEHFFDLGWPDNSYGIDVWQLLPFSRGYVHASSANVFDAPLVQPRYFSVPIDMDIQVAALRGARKVLMQDSLNSLTYNGETTPGFDTIPNGTNLGLYRRWRDWILQGYASVAHPIGTCAMTPQSAGGVVDNQFRLYGASNVRIVDASVLPMQVSAHLSSTLYGIAEKAAATIKGSS